MKNHSKINSTHSIDFSQFNKLNDRIKAARISSGLTQKELSRLSGISVSTISRLENSENSILYARARTVLQICDSLKITDYDAFFIHGLLFNNTFLRKLYSHPVHGKTLEKVHMSIPDSQPILQSDQFTSVLKEAKQYFSRYYQSFSDKKITRRGISNKLLLELSQIQTSSFLDAKNHLKNNNYYFSFAYLIQLSLTLKINISILISPWYSNEIEKLIFQCICYENYIRAEYCRMVYDSIKKPIP